MKKFIITSIATAALVAGMPGTAHAGFRLCVPDTENGGHACSRVVMPKAGSEQLAEAKKITKLRGHKVYYLGMTKKDIQDGISWISVESKHGKARKFHLYELLPK
jgi:hypothetical protein